MYDKIYDMRRKKLTFFLYRFRDLNNIYRNYNQRIYKKKYNFNIYNQYKEWFYSPSSLLCKFIVFKNKTHIYLSLL